MNPKEERTETPPLLTTQPKKKNPTSISQRGQNNGSGVGFCDNCTCDAGDCPPPCLAGGVVLAVLAGITLYFSLGYLGEVAGSFQNACDENSSISDKFKPLIMIVSTGLITWGFIELYKHNFFSGIFGDIDKTFIKHPYTKMVWQAVACVMISLIGVFFIRGVATLYDVLVQRYAIPKTLKNNINEMEGLTPDDTKQLYDSMHQANKKLNPKFLSVTLFGTKAYNYKREIRKAWLAFEHDPSKTTADQLTKKINIANDCKKMTPFF